MNTAQQHGPASTSTAARPAAINTSLQPSCLLPATPAVTYSATDLSALLYMIEEEKLAGDLYDVFYQQTGLRVFDRIGNAEDQHMTALIKQANVAGLNLDAVLSLAEGHYANPELQSLYDTLLASGSVSDSAALGVGVEIETVDIADLQQASVGLTGTALGNVYASLLKGSDHHLAAFEAWLV